MNKNKTATEIANFVLRHLGLQIVRSKNYSENMKELGKIQNLRFLESRNGFLFEFLKKVSSDEMIFKNLSESKGQLYQDLFVLDHLSWKKNGYFVEFGATDGINLSNTYILEKIFNWNGVLAEPGQNWHQSLEKNRSCKISKECVWTTSGEEIQFLESEYPEFSTIEQFQDYDGLTSSRNPSSKYRVNTISLEDLLKQSQSPKHIDYMSIDTEGSELKILKSFPFDKYTFGVLTVEHNHSRNESEIDAFLSLQGYERVHKEVSQFDGWYINVIE